MSALMSSSHRVDRSARRRLLWEPRGTTCPRLDCPSVLIDHEERDGDDPDRDGRSDPDRSPQSGTQSEDPGEDACDDAIDDREHAGVVTNSWAKLPGPGVAPNVAMIPGSSSVEPLTKYGRSSGAAPR